MKNYPNEPSDILPPHNFDLIKIFSSDFATDACHQATKILHAMEVKFNDRELETPGKCMFYLNTIIIFNSLHIF